MEFYNWCRHYNAHSSKHSIAVKCCHLALLWITIISFNCKHIKQKRYQSLKYKFLKYHKNLHYIKNRTHNRGILRVFVFWSLISQFTNSPFFPCILVILECYSKKLLRLDIGNEKKLTLAVRKLQHEENCSRSQDSTSQYPILLTSKRIYKVQ